MYIPDQREGRRTGGEVLGPPADVSQPEECESDNRKHNQEGIRHIFEVSLMPRNFFVSSCQVYNRKEMATRRFGSGRSLSYLCFSDVRKKKKCCARARHSLLSLISAFTGFGLRPGLQRVMNHAGFPLWRQS